MKVRVTLHCLAYPGADGQVSLSNLGDVQNLYQKDFGGKARVNAEDGKARQAYKRADLVAAIHRDIL